MNKIFILVVSFHLFVGLDQIDIMCCKGRLHPNLHVLTLGSCRLLCCIIWEWQDILLSGTAIH